MQDQLNETQLYSILAPVLNAPEVKQYWKQFINIQIANATSRVLNTPTGDATVFNKIAEVKVWEKLLSLPEVCIDVSKSKGGQ